MRAIHSQQIDCLVGHCSHFCSLICLFGLFSYCFSFIDRLSGISNWRRRPLFGWEREGYVDRSVHNFMKPKIVLYANYNVRRFKDDTIKKAFTFINSIAACIIISHVHNSLLCAMWSVLKISIVILFGCAFIFRHPKCSKNDFYVILMLIDWPTEHLSSYLSIVYLVSASSFAEHATQRLTLGTLIVSVSHLDTAISAHRAKFAMTNCSPMRSRNVCRQWWNLSTSNSVIITEIISHAWCGYRKNSIQSVIEIFLSRYFFLQRNWFTFYGCRRWPPVWRLCENNRTAWWATLWCMPLT